jgi:carbon monoxide dehydrogenase subunit G
MNISGEHRLSADRERVWTALHDPEILRGCIPGCEDVQAVGSDQFVGRLMARVGAVSTVFTGRLFISDESFPKGWQLNAHAESPTAGWADGTARIHLASVAGGTVVTYRLHVDPGGRLASVGDRLLRAVAVRMANDFFTRLTELLMPSEPAKEPQEMAEPGGPAPRRMVLPLAPTSAADTAPPSPAVPPHPPQGKSPAQRLIIMVGLAYFAFVLLSMTLALLSRS